MSDSVSQLREIVGTAEQITRQLTPATVIPFNLFDYVETQFGYGFSTGRGLSLLYGDVTGMERDSWSLQCTAAVAFDVQHRPEVGMWVNERNRQSVLGKYYYGVTADGSMSAVLWEMHVWSRVLNFGGMQGQAMIQWLAEIVREAINVSDSVGLQFCDKFGGRTLAPNEQDLMAVFSASSG